MLEKINSSQELKQLSYAELDELCKDIRSFIIENVSQTGGHLASNLGAVELTVALNRIYQAEKDRILFDVGHQCYTHKILNGRKNEFSTLRQFGGISGFPKPYESKADAFIAGHASDSVSLALGMAKARTLLKEDYEVCAVIGDGALTGGLAYEGIENVAASREPIVIILNDNAMSISCNVGGMTSVLRKMRLSQGYYDFKKRYRNVVGIDSNIYRFAHKLKQDIKERVMAGNIFSAMGLNYLGPIDGHDIRALENAIRCAREMRSPVLLHVVTSKGKGCNYAEAHPEIYHGVGRFDKITGKILASGDGYGDVVGREVCSLAKNDQRIVAITAAMTDGTGLFGFSQAFPNRFFDVGIAEEHAVSMAAGMAKQGLIPIFGVYSSFLQRAYDMMIHDVALMGLHVVFLVDRAGLVGNDGETHNGAFDVAYLSSVPGMTVLSPSSFEEAKAMLYKAIYEINGPVAIRYPRGGEGQYRQIHTEKEVILREGSKLTAVCYGNMVNQIMPAVDKLQNVGIDAAVIKIASLNESIYPLVMESLKKTHRLLICEDVCAAGCMGERLLAMAAKQGISVEKVIQKNLGTGVVVHGSVPALLKKMEMDEDGIYKAVICAADWSANE